MTDGKLHDSWIDCGVERMRRLLEQRRRTLGSSHPSDAPLLCQLSAQVMRKAGVQSRDVSNLLDKQGVESTTAIEAVRAFLDNDALWSLTLLGRTGTGKTFAAQWAVTQRLSAGEKQASAAATTQMIFSPHAVRGAWFEQGLLTHLGDAPLLVLDDLGSEPVDRSGYTHAALLEVVKARWARQHKTIVTSSLLPRELRERYGESIVSRLIQGGECVVLRCPHKTRASRL